MTSWIIVFGFTSDCLSAIDRSVQSTDGLVQTTVDPGRAALAEHDRQAASK